MTEVTPQRFIAQFQHNTGTSIGQLLLRITELDLENAALKKEIETLKAPKESDDA